MASLEDAGGQPAAVGMHPDHPLLARAQDALKQQLLSEKQRLQEELREKTIMLNNAQGKRENIGVELYGFQQNLAKLQLSLEQTHQSHQVISRVRTQAEEDLQSLRRNVMDEEGATKGQRAEVEKHQLELDRLAATLKQVEVYNEQMKGEIAVTRRAAYTAEGAVSRLEKDKLEQDFQIDALQDNLKGLQQQLQLLTAQHEAQQQESRAAMETLAEAEAEMAGVHFEKKQLVAQWRSSLLAIQKRDEAVSAIQDALREQQQQELSIEMETKGYKKDVVKQQIANEAVTAVLQKVEGESLFVLRQIEGSQEKQGRLSEVLVKLSRSLEHTEEQIRRVGAEAKALGVESTAVERAHARVVQEVRSIEEDMLVTLSNQTTTEKSTAKMATDIRALRKKIRDEELSVVEAQNELAKLQVDVLNTEAHNARLAETLALLDDELRDKAAVVEKYELEIKRRNDEIEKKTREIDLLNRKLEKMVGGMEGEETGPLEATIKNLQREIDTKDFESKDMQRRWIAAQTELVALLNDNGTAAENVTRMRAEQTVLVQKRRRLEAASESHTKDIRGLNAAMGRLHVQLQRLNGLIASNSAARESLAEDNLHLESRIQGDLLGAEEEAAALSGQIDEGRQHKRDVLAEVVEVERQVMLWERKLLLEKEMREVLDPTVGQDVAGEMRKEIHRMQLRLGELTRLQDKLMADLEKSLSKRELIGLKGRATIARAKQSTPAGKSLGRGGDSLGGGGSLTRGQLDKAVGDLQRSVRDTEKELSSTDSRLADLGSQRSALSTAADSAELACGSLRGREETAKAMLSSTLANKYKLLLATSRQQKQAKRFEDMASGRYRPLVADPSKLDGELAAAGARLDAVLRALDAVRQTVPQLAAEVEKIMYHVDL